MYYVMSTYCDLFRIPHEKRISDNLGILAIKPIYQIAQNHCDLKTLSLIEAVFGFEYITNF